MKRNQVATSIAGSVMFIGVVAMGATVSFDLQPSISSHVRDNPIIWAEVTGSTSLGETIRGTANGVVLVEAPTSGTLGSGLYKWRARDFPLSGSHDVTFKQCDEGCVSLAPDATYENWTIDNSVAVVKTRFYNTVYSDEGVVLEQTNLDAEEATELVDPYLDANFSTGDEVMAENCPSNEIWQFRYEDVEDVGAWAGANEGCVNILNGGPTPSCEWGEHAAVFDERVDEQGTEAENALNVFIVDSFKSWNSTTMSYSNNFAGYNPGGNRKWIIMTDTALSRTIPHEFGHSTSLGHTSSDCSGSASVNNLMCNSGGYEITSSQCSTIGGNTKYTDSN